MIRSMKRSKWAVIVLVALIIGYFAFDKFVLLPQRQAELAGSATLSWTAPTENEDNSHLTDLTGYIIHYSTQAGQYSNTIYVDDPETTSYDVENLMPGTYYLAVTAITSDGRESAFSNMVEKTIPLMTGPGESP